MTQLSHTQVMISRVEKEVVEEIAFSVNQVTLERFTIVIVRISPNIRINCSLSFSLNTRFIEAITSHQGSQDKIQIQ